ncbi:uncharacterized protein K460DRAFT_371826 [Cucurbitaria berberidis CBS 394.84]|uniref:Uncharacterized protein n=1 Tax=Cucurbitaria berberidis CBS 394.84 TaxID=1168544 RepID=A0A9P4L484_9PLEO|nr:uncharacterized protein K460DRAFT_371826 [Cucurbitaria berberidis CBS 394.84]KAF1840623.1 hypothetical protein K460DRAFT_371826 [Cucurbitaria berberidis CBS 394.84]
MASTYTDKQSSPLLRVPAEIRIIIWTHVLGGETFSIHCWRRYTPFGFASRIIQKKRNFLALLATSRQVYSETRLLPFQFNAFRFKHQSSFLSFLAHFATDQQMAIRNVELVTWMARHMVDGEGWVLGRVEECFPVTRFGGLRRVNVEVRMNGCETDCVRGDCLGCGGSEVGVGEEERRVREWFEGKCERVEVGFERVMA